ncbi:hypothetical protein P280DRAFT_50100 [Massarina eburnea CBS 473.64]|uniref:3'-phosphate/5'-hydroxy nucleic acid ligase n=1 Tax=Massarina eburnea CBS 473.64 TaxID=1395130 RepID=A0A6A6RZD7_9PLEO|nr:hypothetical protein P280DRAFT_50100 [Massarina eburnea CBS 473.64]
MPAMRVTIASNANQSIRAPLVIPAKNTSDPRNLIFHAAKSKLRLKKPIRIFLGGAGHELAFEADWKLHLRNDVTLLISAGEEYVGVREVHGENDDTHPECPMYILADKAYVDSLSRVQLENAARTLPGIVHAAGQPDLHPGTKFPIGAAFASYKWIHPLLIGGDIGCGMAWYRTKLSREQVDGDKGKRVAERLRGLEGVWRSRAEREAWLEDDVGHFSTGPVSDSALGTIGAGNHFAEIQVVEETASSEDGLGLKENEVVLLVHSGSRGYGSSVLKRFTSGKYTSFEESTYQAKEYLREHNKACRWAKANRDLIALRFLSCLEPGEPAWDLGRNVHETVHLEKDFLSAKSKLSERRVVDICHNNVERVKWPPNPPYSDLPRIREAQTSNNTALPPKAPTDLDSFLVPEASSSSIISEFRNLRIEPGPQDYVYIHRKGAAPTYNPATNNPFTIIPLPGSRATPTLILKPVFSEETNWGMLNALSLAHGAGRSMSRAKALSSLSQKYKGQNLLEPSKGSRNGEGTWVICDEKDLVYEEAPDAYKDVHAVAEDLVQEGVAKIVGWCRARVSYKVRNEGR